MFIPGGFYLVDWLRLSRKDWHCTGGCIQAKGAGGRDSDDDDVDDFDEPEVEETN
jgi:hypothetical protein